jgi:hypothetical protein
MLEPLQGSKEKRKRYAVIWFGGSSFVRRLFYSHLVSFICDQSSVAQHSGSSCSMLGYFLSFLLTFLIVYNRTQQSVLGGNAKKLRRVSWRYSKLSFLNTIAIGTWISAPAAHQSVL